MARRPSGRVGDLGRLAADLHRLIEAHAELNAQGLESWLDSEGK